MDDPSIYVPMFKSLQTDSEPETEFTMPPKVNINLVDHWDYIRNCLLRKTFTIAELAKMFSCSTSDIEELIRIKEND